MSDTTGFTFESNAYAIAARLEGRPPTIRAALAKVVQNGVAAIQRAIAQTKITTGGLLEPRTGQLRRSLYTTPVQDDGHTISATVGADLGIAPQARIQELGGTVTAKTAAHLAIPIDAALTAKGVARFSARDLIANPGNFGYRGTFTRNSVIFGTLANGDITPLFVLKTSVTLPARPYLASAMAEQAPEIHAAAVAAVGGGPA